MSEEGASGAKGKRSPSKSPSVPLIIGSVSCLYPSRDQRQEEQSDISIPKDRILATISFMPRNACVTIMKD